MQNNFRAAIILKNEVESDMSVYHTEFKRFLEKDMRLYLILGILLFDLLFGSNCYALSQQDLDQTILPSFPLLNLSAVPSIPVSPRTRILLILFINVPLLIINFILLIYCLRHLYFAFNRLFGKSKNVYSEIMEVNWPKVTIIIPAHNEQNVIADLLNALLKLDYNLDLLQVIVVNDRSTDATASIIDGFVASHPQLFTHFYRCEGTPGKSAALADATPMIKNPILLIFDADYVPGPFLLKQLVIPFFDPEVGTIMGRVVPGNTSKNLLTQLIDMDRSGGYQVNQQARENLKYIPQYGGTAGGVRMQALIEVGGWNSKFLADDTEITFRLVTHDWISVYQNKSECIELVPETWAVRNNQIKRWAKGHNQVLFKYGIKILFYKKLSLWQRIDAILLLCIYLISPFLLMSWILFLLSYLLNIVPGSSTIFGFLMIVSITGLGNVTFFYEIATALYLDNLRHVKGNRIRLVPFMFLNCFVSMITISRGFFEQITTDRFKKKIVWQRTEHKARNKD